MSYPQTLLPSLSPTMTSLALPHLSANLPHPFVGPELHLRPSLIKTKYKARKAAAGVDLPRGQTPEMVMHRPARRGPHLQGMDGPRMIGP